MSIGAGSAFIYTHSIHSIRPLFSKKIIIVQRYIRGTTAQAPSRSTPIPIPEWDLIWLIPDSTSYEEASTITACGMTAAQCLFFHLGLPSPFWASNIPEGDEPLAIFLHGASTSLELYAAQLVHLAATPGRQQGQARDPQAVSWALRQSCLRALRCFLVCMLTWSLRALQTSLQSTQNLLCS